MFGILSVQMRSRFSPKDVLRSSFYIYNHYIKCLKKFFYDVFGPYMLLDIHKCVRNRSPRRPFTKPCTFRSLLRPKTRIRFTRGLRFAFPSPLARVVRTKSCLEGISRAQSIPSSSCLVPRAFRGGSFFSINMLYVGSHVLATKI